MLYSRERQQHLAECRQVTIQEYLHPVMVNGIRASEPRELNKGCGLKFCVGSHVQQETPEEGQRTHQPKYCEYNNKDKDNIPKTLNDKNHQALSQKFR